MRTGDKIRFYDRVIIRFMTPELGVGSQVLPSFLPSCPQRKKTKRLFKKQVCALHLQSQFIAIQGAFISRLARSPQAEHFACGLRPAYMRVVCEVLGTVTDGIHIVASVGRRAYSCSPH